MKSLDLLKYLSRISMALQLVFWLIVFMVFYKIMGPSLKIVQAINHFEQRYYSIDYNSKENVVSYKETKELPKNWIPLKQISKRAISAIVVSEDGKFFNHPGYDIEQIQKVMTDKFYYHKKKVRGASTITQQLIKNVYLTKEKSLGRKVKEFYFATLIEEKASKEKILETYLNVIEYGKGIYGIENASQYYFKKSARYLNAKEAAFLAMLLPSPVKYSKSFKQRSLTPFASSIINSVLLKMKQAGHIGEEEYLNSMRLVIT